MAVTIIAANAADGDAYRAKCLEDGCGWAGARRWSKDDAKVDGMRHITTAEHVTTVGTYAGPERRRTAAERNAERLEAELEAERERTAELEREAAVVHAELERVWEVLERTADERDAAEHALDVETDALENLRRRYVDRGFVLAKVEAELEAARDRAGASEAFAEQMLELGSIGG